MKKLLFLFCTVICLGACSVDEQELENAVMPIQEINATFESDGCIVTTFDYSTLGTIDVRNDRDFLYISIKAKGENNLSSIALHLAHDFSGFPTKGKGNLKPEWLEIQDPLGPGVQEQSYKFPLGDYSNNLVIASYTTFNGAEGFWTGDIEVKQGNWAYFGYEIKEHPVNAGPDNSREITLSEARKLPSWDEVRKIYANMLAPGVPKKEGTYSPSIWDLIDDFNDPARESQLGEYTTTYTLGTGDCTDSVILTMIVVPDDESL
ncbi:hypothetical protein FHG64_17430 [Antarcticibacterium flavum]|uniref:Uncharacterized protein n=1 Tax=Antarcticibacterium flavum TaxID=2058175 RepID=A0A5B7X6A2_9FLAO|nr:MULTISPECIES: hypothetical protein [Antarcticibacterium]MCM4159253.1 hypothetical protein [Antarcticibacterium sp. W02-3]QCY71034.1 hypothetical protein FHG64_17430 [Antarcticibacterium flavum]